MPSIIIIWALILIPLIMVMITFGPQMSQWLWQAIEATRGEKLDPAKVWDTGFNVLLVIAGLALAMGTLRFLYLLLNGRSGSAQVGIGKWLNVQVTLGEKDSVPKKASPEEATGTNKKDDAA